MATAKKAAKPAKPAPKATTATAPDAVKDAPAATTQSAGMQPPLNPTDPTPVKHSNPLPRTEAAKPSPAIKDFIVKAQVTGSTTRVSYEPHGGQRVSGDCETKTIADALAVLAKAAGAKR